MKDSAQDICVKGQWRNGNLLLVLNEERLDLTSSTSQLLALRSWLLSHGASCINLCSRICRGWGSRRVGVVASSPELLHELGFCMVNLESLAETRE